MQNLTKLFRKLWEKAEEKAVEKKQIETAKKAILKGFDNETIADLTGLTTEQIKKLRKEKE